MRATQPEPQGAAPGRGVELLSLAYVVLYRRCVLSPDNIGCNPPADMPVHWEGAGVDFKDPLARGSGDRMNLSNASETINRTDEAPAW